MNSIIDRLQAAIASYEQSTGGRIQRKDLAEIANVSQAAVSLWFSGQTRRLKAEPMLRIARFLGVSPDWLMEGKGEMRSGAVDDFFDAVPEYQKKYEQAPKTVQTAADALLALPAEKQREAVSYIEYLAGKR